MGYQSLFCHPFFHTSVTKSCPETLLTHVDAPKCVWYLDNVGTGCGSSFVLNSEVWITALTMEQTPVAGWKTGQIWTRWNAKNIHSNLTQGSAFFPTRVRATCGGWRWNKKMLHKQVPHFNLSYISQLKVSLPIIVILLIYQPERPLSNLPFIIVIRSDVKKKIILWRKKRLFSTEKLVNLWWNNLDH